MPLPPKTDPSWIRLLTGATIPEFSSLATKLTIARLRREVKQQPATLAAAVTELTNFFATNDFAAREASLI